MSQTKEEQFLDSKGPPPLEVPKKTTDISDMVVTGGVQQITLLGGLFILI
jgi:hypothetical protein